MRSTICAFIAAITLLAGQLPAVDVVVNPSPATVTLRNPLKGFRPYGSNPASPYGTICHRYVPWNTLEPYAIADDATAIARIRSVIDGTDQSIDGWQEWSLAASRGYRVIPRVYLIWPGSPDRLYWPSDLAAYDFFSDTFLARMQNLVRRMGLAFKDDPRFAAGVYMGIHGLWGEHHLWGYDSRYPGKTIGTFPDELESIYSTTFNAAFPTTPIMRRYYSDFPGQNYGVYWDSFAHPDLDGERDGIVAMGGGVGWKTAIVSGEVAYDWGRTNQFNGSSPDDSLSNPTFYNRITKYARLTHANNLGWIAEYSANSSTATGAAVLQDALGWKFAVPEARFSGRVEAGGTLDLTLRVRNDGSSPLYATWPVGVALLDPNTLAPVWRSVMTNADTRTWMPGTDFDFDQGYYRTAALVNTVHDAMPIPASLANGEYLLAIALLDPAGMRPNGRFAIANFVANGWQPLGRIGVGQNVANAQQLPAFTNPNASAPAYHFTRASLPAITAGPSATPATVSNGQTTLSVSANAPDGAALSVTWLVSGPGEVRLSANNAAISTPVTAQFSQTGTYRFTAFVVGSNGASASAAMNVAVTGLAPSTNSAPTISSATATTLTATTASLAATASDDGGEAALSYRWSASPASVAFSANDSNAAKSCVATFSASGTYTLTVTATDAGGLSASRQVSVTISAPPSGGGNGLTGTYFTGTELSGTGLSRIDAQVNFAWGNDAPMSGIPADGFSVRWTGQVQAQFSETYTFTTTSDDGVRLWINGQQLIDNWTVHAPTDDSGTITLVAGQKYDLRMEFYDSAWGAVAQLSWASASTAKQIIPQSQLYLPNQAPSVTVTAPASGTAGSAVALSATASDSDGSIASVAFFVGGTLLATVSDSPYAATWTPSAAGSYAVTATATDNLGTSTTSAVATVTVTGAAAPAIALSSTTVAPGGQLTVTVSGGPGNARDWVGVFLSSTPIGSDEVPGFWQYLNGAQTAPTTGRSSATLVFTMPTTIGTYDVRFCPNDGYTPMLARSATVTVSAAPAGTGLQATYFTGRSFDSEVLRRTDATVDFDWGSGAPASSVGADNFSVRWSGQVQAQFTETYTFSTMSDDGVRLWVNGQQLIDNWTDHAPTENSATIALVAGQRYDLRMEFYENGGGAVAKLSWASASTPKQIIPTARLFPSGSNGLPAGWTAQDVGSVATAGATTHSAGSWTVTGSGADIWGTADGFRFAYQRLSGDVQLTARVDGLSNTDIWAKAGVMIRTSLTAGSAHASTFATSANGIVFQRRATTDGSSAHTAGPGSATPYWVRIERVGDVVISSASPNGSTWTEIRRETISLGAVVHVGLAVTSHSDGALCTGTFSNVQIVGAAAAAN